MLRISKSVLALILSLAALSSYAEDAKAKTTFTAGELIAALKASKPKGDVQIRASIERKGQPTLQIQIKRHSSGNGEEFHLYQILFPKDRKGEGLALRVKSSGFSGWSFKPGGAPQAVGVGDRLMPLFGTDVLVEDLLTDFINWPKHSLTKTEKIGAADFSVVESKGATQGHGTVTTVRSWIETERLYPKRIELLDAKGAAVRVVETLKVGRASNASYYVPVEFSVTTVATGTSTSVTGRGLRDDLTFTDEDFSEAALARGVGRQEEK